MSFIYLVWKIKDEKIKKSKREKKNKILEKEIERNMEIKNATESDFYNKFTDKVIPDNNQTNMNLINFRDSIEINVEKRNNNREILEKRLNSRERMSYGCVNPFLTTNKYLDDISNEDKFLRPRNTNEINKKEKIILK
tara:strand:- start:9 stop:422 length:414 start_codon:yes stop_codon:yes gene_type:complete